LNTSSNGTPPCAMFLRIVVFRSNLPRRSRLRRMVMTLFSFWASRWTTSRSRRRSSSVRL